DRQGAIYVQNTQSTSQGLYADAAVVGRSNKQHWRTAERRCRTGEAVSSLLPRHARRRATALRSGAFRASLAADARCSLPRAGRRVRQRAGISEAVLERTGSGILPVAASGTSRHYAFRA